MAANEEIDSVLPSDTHTILVECKWSRRLVGSDILKQLEGKSKALLKEVNGQAALFGLCSWSGFTNQVRELAKQRKDVMLYDWKEMVDLAPLSLFHKQGANHVLGSRSAHLATIPSKICYSGD